MAEQDITKQMKSGAVEAWENGKDFGRIWGFGRIRNGWIKASRIAKRLGGSRVPILKRVVDFEPAPISYGKEKPTEIYQELRPLITKNEQIITELKDIEDKMGLAFDEKIQVEKRYHKQGPYSNAEEVENEHRFFENGTNFKEEKEKGSGRVTGYKIHGIKITRKDGKDSELAVLGHANARKIRQKIEDLFKIINEKKADLAEVFNETEFVNVKDFKVGLNDLLGEIQRNEEVFFGKLTDIKGLIELSEGPREELTVSKLAPPNVAMKHTYKIIKESRMGVVDGVNTNLKFYEEVEKHKKNEKSEVKNFKKIGSEIEHGLDERGWPLEVYKEGGKWYPIIDKWIKELMSNDWQTARVKKKIDAKHAAAKEISNADERNLAIKQAEAYEEEWDALIKHATKDADKSKREVAAEWVGNVDMLELVNYVFNEWDPMRDDFRDARYHPHSKVVFDYIQAGDGLAMTDQRLEVGRKIAKPFDVRYHPKIVPDITIKRKDSGWWDNNPFLRKEVVQSKLPHDEQKVTRFCRNWDSTNANEPTAKLGMREPSHLSPAFDRSALSTREPAAGADVAERVHFGRLYYYDTCEGINEFFENPEPTITSRGIAKYLMDRIERSTVTFEEARMSMKGKEWDYGIRGFKRPFTTDPFGGDILHYGNYG